MADCLRWHAPALAFSALGRRVQPCLTIYKLLNPSAFVNLSVSGETAQGWTSDATARDAIIQKGSHLICELGFNDIYVGSRSAAQLTSDLGTLYALARSGQKVFQTTITPTSGGSWGSLGTQTPNSNNSVRVTFNTAVRGAPGTFSTINGYYDAAAAWESSFNSGLWVVTPSGPYTVDGVHGNANGYLLVPTGYFINPVVWP